MSDVFDMLRTVPWWVGVLAAGFFCVLGLVTAAFTGHSPAGKAFQPIVFMFFAMLAGVALLAALFSAIGALSRRKLLDGQANLESVRALSWVQFEQLVGEAFRRQGYTVEETGGGGADGGVDLILRGRGETVLVQCKQWRERQVGVPKVRELFGVVTAERASRGILVTSGSFTHEAQSFASGKPLTLIDGPALARLIQDVRASAAVAGPAPAPTPAAVPSQSPASAPVTPTCPQCASPMVLRVAKKGANAGSSFYGCSRYPACKGTRPAA